MPSLQKNNIRASDYLVFAAIFLAWCLSFLLVGTPYPYHYDSVNFALAIIDRFDIGIQQPHPPGFLFHAACAKFVNLFVHQPFYTQQILNIIYQTSLLILFLKYIHRNRSVFLVLSLAPLFLFLPAVPLSQAAGIPFGAAIALFVYKITRGNNKHFALVVTFALGIAFRTDLVVYFLPVVLFVHLIYRPTLKQALVSTGAGALILLIWYTLTDLLSSGPTLLQATGQAQRMFTSGTSVFFGASLFEHARSSLRFIFYYAAVLGPGGLFLLYGYFSGGIARIDLLMFAAATVPLALYGLLVHIPFAYYFAPVLAFAAVFLPLTFKNSFSGRKAALCVCVNILFFAFVPKPLYESDGKTYTSRSIHQNILKQLRYSGAAGRSELVHRKNMISSAGQALSGHSSFSEPEGVLWDRIWYYMGDRVWGKQYLSSDSAEVLLERVPGGWKVHKNDSPQNTDF